MLDSVQSQSFVIDLWRLSGNEIGGNLSFCLQDTYDTYVTWSEGLWCVFVCQLKQESSLLQIGLWVEQHRARLHELLQYFPKKNEYSNIKYRNKHQCPIIS
ncbi:Testis- and ovary-specific PAZ domain-containing protein [Actinidia chinensis var. chinensis]|uniref:Testis-and ovary-specific PAZ domain-containing protein n=1 Tax=Actinidia chinensis var. chinensis TaxID=1590841 RepID=A0A2R6PCI8_ACTCC|nr:Testis- and ovary-specific PAZ domain-containing protein [Actinidia chinensis var. chinensis]